MPSRLPQAPSAALPVEHCIKFARKAHRCPTERDGSGAAPRHCDCGLDRESIRDALGPLSRRGPCPAPPLPARTGSSRSRIGARKFCKNMVGVQWSVVGEETESWSVPGSTWLATGRAGRRSKHSAGRGWVRDGGISICLARRLKLHLSPEHVPASRCRVPVPASEPHGGQSRLPPFSAAQRCGRSHGSLLR